VRPRGDPDRAFRYEGRVVDCFRMAITAAARPAERVLPAGWYDWLFLAATAWLVGGAFLDA